MYYFVMKDSDGIYKMLSSFVQSFSHVPGSRDSTGVCSSTEPALNLEQSFLSSPGGGRGFYNHTWLTFFLNLYL